MRYCMSLLLGVLVLGILGTALPASADYETNSFNLERTIIRGYVESVQNQVAYIQSYEGDEFAVQLGPESYWESHHYYLPEGAYVEMEVWYDPTDQYTDWYFAGEIWGPDFHFALTNDDGTPCWVIYADDYYFSLGYRASCVSYMFWYDCPPVYFVYLILPPPPPWNYVCYYGPHWRTHHSDWHHGSRYGSGGSYWNDGEGYERPGRRSHGKPVNDPRWDSGTTNSVSIADQDQRPTKPEIPKVKLQPVLTNKVVVPQQMSQTRKPDFVFPMVSKVSTDKAVTPPRTSLPQSPVYVTPTVRMVSTPQPSLQPQQFQTRSNSQSNSDASKSAVVPQATRETGKAQVNPQPRVQNEKRPVADSQGQELKQIKR
jgi:hypothetical protein